MKRYGNEEAVGKAIRESGIPREDLFVTTKLKPSDAGKVAEAFQKSLELLDIGYIDLPGEEMIPTRGLFDYSFLIHWPMARDPVTNKTLPPSESPTVCEIWAQMEKLLDTGVHDRVSNFSLKTLPQLLATAKVIPAVNQIEVHPYLPNEEIADFCASKGIHVTAYCPLGQYNSPILAEKVVTDLAEKYNKTAGQVLLSWAVQRGISVVPKSANPTRQAQNLDVFELSKEEMEIISLIHKEEGKTRNLCSYGNGLDEPGKIFGWTFEEMGWDPKWFPSSPKA
ncbi:hypothetical protein HWV62_3152 [Athelia sp. TMB]|nr:hypothetical protein HWV62_3152 [Athelia sp. TMB]